jgi:hypothetical protein
MKPIWNPPPPAIGPGSDCDAIANLHEALVFLLGEPRAVGGGGRHAELRREIHHRS